MAHWPPRYRIRFGGTDKTGHTRARNVLMQHASDCTGWTPLLLFCTADRPRSQNGAYWPTTPTMQSRKENRVAEGHILTDSLALASLDFTLCNLQPACPMPHASTHLPSMSSDEPPTSLGHTFAPAWPWPTYLMPRLSASKTPWATI